MASRIRNQILRALGKIDISGFFDSNEVAGDETTQFLSPGFVHSVAIEFPDDSGPGVVVEVFPSELWDVAFGWGEADADFDELGRRPFLMGEVRLHPELGGRKGNYRFYGWWREKRGDEARGWKDEKEDGWGLGLSVDQAVAEGVALFGRLGYQNEELTSSAGPGASGCSLRGALGQGR